MGSKKSKYGRIGIAVGGGAFLLGLVHFWAGPFSPEPTIEMVLAEKSGSIWGSALDVLKGKESIQQQQTVQWDKDKVVEVVTAVFGGLAFVLGVFGYAAKESLRIVGVATALGINAIAFQFIGTQAVILAITLSMTFIVVFLEIETRWFNFTL